ncbi:hypothetical protein EZV76_02830 [Flagellimonas alvinocaridis]|uniref:Alpha/beta hydrolase n=1 Tax=Flagellimonas alvinocaridis TaxID=2530200 RepID=A0A4S8RRE4_9FLAO|nr:hypothetical protein [Allomuricauda alvinocaridis]THV61278.1 hypothetical protein EZV76_02830 [Allomuricauda alvinocaridis]
MRTIFLIWLIFLCPKLFLYSQTSFKKGIVHDTIQVSGAQGESFALYLPDSYSDAVLSPIVFIFDPAARGRAGIQPFIEASEKHGLVLVCSNNSRNAPYERNFKIADHLFNHVFSNFNIQKDGIYAAGFSGGSRLASAIASLTNQFAGVIGCGAGFSGQKEHMPTTQTYSYVGLCGYRDMNYSEMMQNRDYLDQIHFSNTLITFDDEHRWPHSSHISRAFDWLYLQKLKANNSEDTALFMKQYSLDYQWLKKIEAQNEPILLAEQYVRMLTDYGESIQVDSLRQGYAALQESTTYKKQSRKLKKALLMEQRLGKEFRSQFSKDFEGSDKPDFNWWKENLKKLTALGKNEDVQVQRMVYRLKYDLFARAFSRKSFLANTSFNDQVALLDRFLEILSSFTK